MPWKNLFSCAGCDTICHFKGSFYGYEFRIFFLLDPIIKIEEPSLPYYLLIVSFLFDRILLFFSYLMLKISL